MDYAKIINFLEENELDQLFSELNNKQYHALRLLGVPEYDSQLPRGEGYTYAGSSCFQWVNDPVIVHY